MLRVVDSPLLATASVDYVIDLAKEIGLIAEIGAWVLNNAFAQLNAWRSAGLSGGKLAINTCYQELVEPDYVNRLIHAMEQNGHTAGDIELELTERDAIQLDHLSSNILHQLSDLGFGIVLDDFGTGYSSLSYLRSLPVGGLKLDKSFLKDVPDDPDANSITRAVILLAHELRLRVVAEGVENRDQMQFLRDAGCHAFQGFLLAAPMSGQEATAWLASRPPFTTGEVSA